MDYGFKGKKVVLMGLGVLGRGVNVAKFLAECGATLLITDTKNAEALQESLDQLKQFPDITYRLGEHRLEDFSAAGGSAFGGHSPDMVIKAAGVPFDSAYIAEAQKNGIPIKMDASLFCELAPQGVIFVGVTGTRGKTTTTQLIYNILRTHLEAFPPSERKQVFLGGNIRGLATLPLLKEVQSGDVVVMELDSWQLQGFGDAGISPNVAVFTNLYPDHQNYYRDRMEHYFADKANIFKNQKVGDTLVVGEQAYGVMENYGCRTSIVPIVVRAGDVPSDWQPQLLGEHNRANIACAIAAAHALGVTDQTIKTAVESFSGVEGRLQYLRTVRGVKIYNDNNATTAEATVAALRALDPEGTKNIVLIMGGTDKGLDMSILVREIGLHCKAAVLLDESGTRRMGADIEALPDVIIKWCDGLAASLHTAMQIAKAGDIILFSPAFASFGTWFKNEYDRNDQFIALVQKL